MTKQELRTLYKQKRLALSGSERSKLDDLLLIQLQRLSFNDDVTVVMSYWPLAHHAEMNTHLYTNYLEYSIPGLKVTFPVIDYSACEMQAVQINEDTDFTENEHGITEPESGEKVSADEIDLVLVPLLAFDKKGFRVGFGKGFYDRFLKQCRKDVITVGFSYFEAVDKIEDANQFDVPLDYCITPHKIYEF